MSTLYAMRAQGYSHDEIAERLGRSRRAIRWKIYWDRQPQQVRDFIKQRRREYLTADA